MESNNIALLNKEEKQQNFEDARNESLLALTSNQETKEIKHKNTINY